VEGCFEPGTAMCLLFGCLGTPVFLSFAALLVFLVFGGGVFCLFFLYSAALLSIRVCLLPFAVPPLLLSLRRSGGAILRDIYGLKNNEKPLRIVHHRESEYQIVLRNYSFITYIVFQF
jgi:hypothetical protein